MNNYTHRQLAFETLETMRGHQLDLVNCYRDVFAELTPAEMQELHGGTGLTRAQALAEAEKLTAKFGEVIAWLKDST